MHLATKGLKLKKYIYNNNNNNNNNKWAFWFSNINNINCVQLTSRFIK